MDSSSSSSSVAIFSGDGQNSGRYAEHSCPAGKRLQCRRARSSCSCSLCSSDGSPFSLSSLSSNYDGSPFSPIASIQLSGIPFSWERLPGIPKKSSSSSSSSLKIKDPNSLTDLLPLPPAVTTSRKFNLDSLFALQKRAHRESYKADPFVAALVKCSRENHEEVADFWHRSGKVSRVMSDRFGVIDRYVSCKSSCSVTEPIPIRPRPRRAAYSMIRKL